LMTYSQREFSHLTTLIRQSTKNTNKVWSFKTLLLINSIINIGTIFLVLYLVQNL
jgi:hypothetical protein